MDLAPDSVFFFFPLFHFKCAVSQMLGGCDGRVFEGGLSSVKLAVLFKSCFFCLIWPSMCHLLILMDPDPLLSSSRPLLMSVSISIFIQPLHLVLTRKFRGPRHTQSASKNKWWRRMPRRATHVSGQKAALEHVAKTAVGSLLARTMCACGRGRNSPLPQARGSLYCRSKLLDKKALS